MSLSLIIARDGVPFAPSDTVVYSPPLQGVYVGSAGNVTLVTPAGTSLLFTAPPIGSIIPVQAAKVMATGTTAGALVGFK
jgi:hypothetical protein